MKNIFLITILLFMTLLVYLQSWSWYLSFTLTNLTTSMFSINLFLDSSSMIFMITVINIYMCVFIYTFSYMKKEVYLSRFMYILMLFILSMLTLILSGNLTSSLIGWDGLGITSMFLILFYYSESSFKASVLTFLMNRIGDCFFMMILVNFFLTGSEVSLCLNTDNLISAVLLISTSITKSAQVPFSTWLPAAMEAPTPVSALVHSSTLVTAGIFLLYRYSELWMSTYLQEVLLVLSISTSLMAALSALVETDLKKLVALSTLSQMGFILMSFSLGSLMPGFMHMVTHAYFKALLFMTAGYLIHSFKSSQTIYSMNLAKTQSPVIMVIMMTSLLSMMGLPFMSGFYSKDFMIDMFKLSNWSMILWFMIVTSLLCTALYSMRMVWYLMSSSSNWNSMSDNEMAMIKPMFPMMILSVVGGSTINWMLDVNLSIDSSKELILLGITFSIFALWSSKSVMTMEFLEAKWNLTSFNSMISNSFFTLSMNYYKSSDLSGIPEIINKFMLKALKSSGIDKSMTFYQGNLEILMFSMILLWFFV